MDLGGAGGGRGWSQWLIVGALLVIIVGAVVTSIYSCLGPEAGSSTPPTELHFKCGKCGREFEKSHDALSSEAASGEMVDEEDPRFMIDCPACKAKQSCAQMVKCPECGKYFVAFQFVPSPTDPNSVVLGKEDDVCPHCQTNRVEWYRKDYERRKGR